MKIYTLIENTACRPDLTAEHGLSLYIETQEVRILFDAGQSGAFADNARRLGVDLRRVDLAVLSHGHYDHGGGLARFMRINPTAPVYLKRQAFEPHYNGQGRYIGLDPALAGNPRLIFAEETQCLAPGICLYSGISCVEPVEPYGLRMRGADGLRPEDFRHEQYLIIREGEKKICFSGCSHRGIRNIVHWFRPDVLVGGFHFKQLAPRGDGAQTLRRAALQLLEYPTVYYTGHCTGTEQFAFLKHHMGTRLHAISTGSVIEI